MTTTPSASAALPPTAAPRLWPGLLLSLAGGVVAWLAIGYVHPAFEVPERYHVRELGAAPERLAALKTARQSADRNNAILYGVLIGTLLALGLSLGQAAARRSLLWPVIAAHAAGLAGGVAGLAASRLAAGGDQSALDAQLIHSVTVQATWWAIIGLGVGIGTALHLRSWRSVALSAFGGTVAGGLAGLLYPVGMSVLLPDVDSQPLVPLEWSSRLIWIALAAALIGVIAQSASRPAVKPA